MGAKSNGRRNAASGCALATVLIVGVPGADWARADCQNYWCSDVYIERIYPNTNSAGTVYINTSGNESLLTQCTPVSGVYLKLSGDNPGVEKVYALLLTAHERQRPVQIVAQNGSSDCSIAYVTSDIEAPVESMMMSGGGSSLAAAALSSNAEPPSSEFGPLLPPIGN